MSARPDDLAVAPDQRAVGLVVEGHLREAGDHQRIHESEQHGEHEDRADRSNELGAHVSSPPGS